MKAELVDIHSHVAPGIDDGARNMTESLELLELAASQGVAVIAATPHVDDICTPEGAESIMSRVQSFLDQVKTHSVRVVSGAEVMVRSDLSALLQRCPNLSYNGQQRYALVEMPISTFPLYAEQVFFELRVRGTTPVIAHPERYLYVQQDPNRFFQIVRTGAVAQATAESLLLPRTAPMRRTVEILIRCGMVCVIASDAHSIVERSFRLREAADIAGRWIGNAAAHAMITETPRRIVDGSPVEMHPEPYKRFWGMTRRSRASGGR